MAQKKEESSILIDTAPERGFWLCDGRTFKNLKELAEALQTMDETVWNYHVTDDKNDFANWIEDVFEEKQLGATIRKAKSPRTAAKRISTKIESPKFWSFLI
jgi:hypothetical protein